MVVVGLIGMVATVVGSLAMSVLAGKFFLNATLRAMESAMVRQAPATAGADVADFAEFARRASGPLPSTEYVELEQAA
jgi:hypothetical protein